MNTHALRSFAVNCTIAAGAMLAVVGTSIVATRFLTNGLDAHSDDPAHDYETAFARLRQLQQEEEKDERVNSSCRSLLLTHGSRVERVIVLVHGLTNCPQQYEALAPLFHTLGYNVLVPRMPRHGFADRMTDELNYLTAEEMRTFGNTMVDIACGLGEHVTFVGISVGGVVAAWVAQHRAEVEKVVLIAPSLTLGRVSATINAINMNILLALPSILTQYIAPFQDGPQQSYLGYSSRALGQMMRLGASVGRSALKHRPAVRSIVVITNAADTAVNNLVTWQLMGAWRAKGMEHLEAYEFPKALHLIHDVIDPQQTHQQTALVYPVLLKLITR